MHLPRLHLVTDEGIVRGAGFTNLAADLMRAHGSAIALHLRGRALSGRELYDIAVICVSEARSTGALLVVNDRVDVALCSGAPAVQLPGGSLGVRETRRIVGEGIALGSSIHSREEASRATDEGADFLLAGTVFTTPSHPETGGSGTGWLSGVASLGRPVIAIGGIDAERAAEAMDAGAYGIAVMRAVWCAEDPVAAVGHLLDAIADRPRGRTRGVMEEK